MRDSDQNLQQVVPFLYVSDMDRSIPFYVDGLGFEIKDRWDDNGKLRWCWLQRDDVALMLQEDWKSGPNMREYSGKRGEGISLCVKCQDALAFQKEVTAKGIATQEPFEGNDLWWVNIVDPDGYELTYQSPV
jgi:lactoylglutathione lyase